MMRQLTKDCFPKADVSSGMVNMSNNNNADVMDTPDLASGDTSVNDNTDATVSPKLASAGTRIGDAGVTDGDVASAGESSVPATVAAPTTITSDVTDATEPTQSSDITSAATSATEYVFIFIDG